MKKVLAIFCCMVLLCACSVNETNKEEENQGNYTDEMKISYALDLSEEDGADSAEREGCLLYTSHSMLRRYVFCPNLMSRSTSM